MNDELLDILEDIVARILESNTSIIDTEFIKENIRSFAELPQFKGKLTEREITIISKRLETRFDITMGIGSILKANDYIPWLDDNRGGIDWYYWDRYKWLLSKNSFSPSVIQGLDIVSNKIIDHLENPKKEGSWARKGLVVGHVQSGKTANYTGVIAKAADSGYKVIIVLAGLIKPLRDQTQIRIDEGFIGLDSSKQLDVSSLKEKRIGVGFKDYSRTPISLTTSTQDFKNKIANQLGAQIKHFNEPVVLVIKKNVSILKNLINWLKSNNLELNNVPMLLIDDEADHASINTKKDDQDPTTTNKRIRELLSLFEKNSYLGYTATPFANIFINPDSENEMLNDDLFPRDFIISLDAPSNYMGAKRIFDDESDLNILREIDDYADILPLKHKKDEFPESIPSSLKEAIRSFILIKASRSLRGQRKKHNSMLINISRFTDIQSHLKLLVHDYLTELREAISIYYALSEKSALKDSSIADLKYTWNKEFNNTEYSWADIQNELKNAISPVKVIEVNSSRNAEPLDYNEDNFPNGRNLIAVGGISLSRGLTLEGLTVSYFLRNSIMYDTLMQMGRWFGYRTNFEDLCRIYMSEEAISWYSHISRATEELRNEFKNMEKAQMTPRDFGLCVRSHPESLIVTARNKMRSGRSIVRKISLEGRLVETSTLIKTKEVVQDNHQALHQLLRNIPRTSHINKEKYGYLFNDIPVANIATFLNSFINHPASQKTEKKPLIDYLDLLKKDGINTSDLILISLSSALSDNITKKELPSLQGNEIVYQKRTLSTEKQPESGIRLNKNRVASRGHEKSGLTMEQINSVEQSFYKNNPETKNFPDHIYRSKRTKPLLMIHLLDCRYKGNENKTIFPDGIVAYGISFPGEAGSRKPENLVEYVVNTTWWDKNYSDILDEDDSDE